MKATTSACVPETAATVLRHWRSNSVDELAPRQSMTAPVSPPRQLLPVVSSVLKKLSRFIPTTRVSPPTAGGLVGRGFVAWKSTVAAGDTGRMRYALALAALPPQV